MNLRALLRKGGVVASGLVSLGVWKLLALWAVARWFGPEVQGGVTLCLSVMGVGAVALGVGLEYSNAFLVGSNSAKARGVVVNTLLVAAIAAALGVAWVAVALELLPQAAEPLGPHLVTGIAVMALTLGLMVAASGLQATAIGRQKYGDVARANLVAGIVWGLGALVAVNLSYLAVLIAWLAASAVTVAWYLRRLWEAGSFGVDPATLRAQLEYGAKTLPGSLARVANMRAALYLTAVFLPPEDVGVYGVMIMLAETLLILPTALGQVVLGATAARSLGLGEYRSLVRLIALVGVAISIVVYGFGNPVLEYTFGNGYGRGGPVLAVLVLGVTFHAIGLFHVHRHYGRGEPLVATQAQFVALILTLVGGFALIPRLGLMGAAGATAVTYAGFALYLALQRHRTDEVFVTTTS